MLYAAAGVLAGFVIARPPASATDCIPIPSIFGVLSWNCSDPTVSALLSITVGWPRWMILNPVIAISFFKAGLLGGGLRWLLTSAAWLVYSIPVLLILWAGTLYWWKRHRATACNRCGARHGRNLDTRAQIVVSGVRLEPLKASTLFSADSPGWSRPPGKIFPYTIVLRGNFHSERATEDRYANPLSIAYNLLSAN